MGASVSSKSTLLHSNQRNSGIDSSPGAPIRFHNVHGENIALSGGGATARRVESFCKGISFSSRPIRVNEYVCLKFVDTANSWSGSIRFGFTSSDPNSFGRGNIPKYACPDLTNKTGFWAKALAEGLFKRDAVLYYYVNQVGEVHFGINGVDKGVFITGVDTHNPLWALIDIYGNTVAVEFVDSANQLNNQRSSLIDDGPVDQVISSISRLQVGSSVSDSSASSEHQHQRSTRQINSGNNHPLQPFLFHNVHGKNVRLTNDRTIAARVDTEFAQGYAFSTAPLPINHWWMTVVLNTEEMYVGSLAFGLTSCNPSNIKEEELPEDSDVLLDRPEYWVVSKDVANSPQRGDELAFCITSQGQVLLSKNRETPTTLMHVDETQQLWAFLDVYGHTQKMKSLGICSMSSIGGPSASLQQVSGQSLSISLPPSGDGVGVARVTFEPSTSSSASSDLNVNSVNEGLSDNATNECTVCYERPVDSVLYSCGHMCMCHTCAQQQWNGSGHCPICRAEIRDVIRIYRS